MSMKSKPPLGTVPEDVYTIERIQNLIGALYRYSTYEGFVNKETPVCEVMLVWLKEVEEKMKNILNKKEGI